MIAHPIRVIITIRNNKPCIELRKVITDLELIKDVTTSILEQKPIILQPTVLNRVKYIGRLKELGIIYEENKTLQYLF
jgi:hypothetical protein